MSPTVGALHVVVPVRDEELALAACLDAVAASLEHVRADRPGLATRVTVVLDRCSDASASIARAAGVATLELRAGAVGAARAAGVASTPGWLAASGCPASSERGLTREQVWIATTDADSRVPLGWLGEHLDLADAGAGLVLGPVRLDPVGTTASVLTRWEEAHPGGAGAVFGANLGFRLDGYDRVGGFAPVREHEDAGLVAALLAAGVTAVRSTLPVTTSARTAGRTPGGLAGYLADLVGPVG